MPKCGNCDYPLICQCGKKFTLASQRAYEQFYDRLGPVRCPSCGEILACKHCGYTYDAGESEPEEYPSE